VARLYLSGVLDAASRSVFQEAVSRLQNDSVHAIVLDMRGLSSCDDDSIAAILAAYRHLEEAGRSLIVLNADHNTGRQLESPRSSRLIDKDRAFRGLELPLKGAADMWEPIPDGDGGGRG